MARLSTALVFSLSVLGCDDSDPGEAASAGAGTGSGGSAGSTASGGSGAVTGGSAGATVTGGASGSAPTSGSGGTSAGIGIVETGPPCTPNGPTTTELGAAMELVWESDPNTNLGPAIQSVEVAPSGIYLGLSSPGDLYRIEPGGTTPTLVVDNAGVGYSNRPGADGVVRADATHVYWATSTGIRRAAIGTWAAETVLDGVNSIDFIQIDATSVYFGLYEQSLIGKVPLAGGSVTELMRDEISLTDMKVAGGFVYAGDSTTDRVGRIPVDGGPVEWLTAMADAQQGVLPLGDTLFFTDHEGIYRSPLADPTAAVRIGQLFSTPSDFTTGSINNFVVKGDRLYWNDANSNVGWTKLDGSECDLLARDVGSEFSVDDTYVYVSRGRTLVRIPR